MVQEDKVRLMAKAAIYEKKEQKGALSVCKYRRQDYIFVQMLKTAVCASVGAAVLALLWFFYQPESFLDELKLHTLVQVLIGIAAAAVFLVILLLVLSFFISRRHYDRCREKNRQYSQVLKRLYHLYEMEENAKKTAGGMKSDDRVAGSAGEAEELIQ